jgi:TonB-dependent starch-binding outer membrane protein SusC
MHTLARRTIAVLVPTVLVLISAGMAFPGQVSDGADSSTAPLLLSADVRAGLASTVAGLHVEDVPLAVALRELSSRSATPVAYSPSLLPEDHLVSCACADVPVEMALRMILKGSGFEVSQVGEQLIVRRTPPVAPTSPAALSWADRASSVPWSGMDRPIAELATNAPGSRRTASRQGAVEGVVREAGTMRPLAAVQVSIQGTGLGTLTNREGRYALENVPSGEVTVVAQSIGYSTGRETVTVRTGTSITVDFALRETAISLDELVVTGTAGATERRRLGNTISTIDAADVTTNQPIASMDELLQGRASGVSVLQTSGTVGTGSRIQVRGLVSVSQNNTPLIYIDGVRVDNSKEDAMVGGQGLSRLQDLPVGDIERVEIIKGAAATTLYGTEASAGVIQIFTKRGEIGAPQFSAQFDYGFERVPTGRFQTGLYTEFVGPDGLPARDPLELLETGHQTGVRLEMKGGTEGIHYFLGGGVSRQEGSLTPDLNHLRQVSMRGNVTAVPSERLSVTMNSGYTRSDLRLPPGDNAIEGLLMNLTVGVPYGATEDRPWGEPFTPVAAIRQIENRQAVQRFTGGVTVEYLPRENLRNTAVLGLDWVDQETSMLFPFGYLGGTYGEGRRDKWDRTFSNVSVDLRSVYSTEFDAGPSLQVALGAQGNFSSDQRTYGRGDVFPAPGVSTISAAARTQGGEISIEEVTAGLFSEGTLGLGDRLFLTAGLRLDGNSAFGDEFDTQIYPKASVAYNISDERFWPVDLIPTTKLRVAWGRSGLAPAQFAADRTYEAVSALGGEPAVTPGNLGDPFLAPEKSSELEVGFDAGFFEDRLGLAVTYFRQKTTDALVPAQFAPSGGFLVPQLKNVGSIQNTGFETTLNALVVARPSLSVTADLELAWQTNEVLDMGGSPPIVRHVVDQQQVREGYPVDGFWTRRLLGWDAEARHHIYSDGLEYHGAASPKHFGSFTLGLDLWDRVRVGALADWATGHYKNNTTRYFQIAYRTGDEYLATVERPTGTPTAASDSLSDRIARGGIGTFIEPADFLKLREVSLSYRMPQAWLDPIRLRNATFRVAARNLHVFTKYSGVDPEITWDGRDGFNTGAEFNTLPPPRRLTFSIRTDF